MRRTAWRHQLCIKAAPSRSALQMKGLHPTRRTLRPSVRLSVRPSVRPSVRLQRGIMKTLVTLGLLTLLCLLPLHSAYPVAQEMVLNDGCCSRYSQTAVPKDKVKHVAMTPSSCKHAAVIVTAVSNKKFCVDPNWKWAKNQLKEFKKSAAASS